LKISFKIPKGNEEKDRQLAAGGWVPLKEPEGAWTEFFLSLPFLIASGAISLGLMAFHSGKTCFGLLKEILFSIWQIKGLDKGTLEVTINFPILLFLPVFLLIHELLHLAFIPDFIRSDKTYLGLAWFGGYVYTEEILTKRRAVWISLAPFVLLSVILPFILGGFVRLSPAFEFFIFLNALGSSVDLLNAFLLSAQVPRKALVLNNGRKTYWHLT